MRQFDAQGADNDRYHPVDHAEDEERSRYGTSALPPDFPEDFHARFALAL
ncbi:hypothetical protein [Streptomyces monomycini]|nr:hypothetical protein [Streptomyces monomycini]